MEAIFTEINILNFRSIKSQNIKLGVRNVIVGKNNSGKSNLISAINHCLNFSTLEKEDVYASKDDPFNENKEIIIDILLRPFGMYGIEKNFNSKWISVLGDSIQFDKDGFAYVGIRSICKFDKDKNRYNHKKTFIAVWSSDIAKTTTTSTFSREIYENIIALYLDAQRDISKDIVDRKSLWSKLTSDIKIEDDSKSKIENQIKEINQSLIDKSDTLKRIKAELGNGASESKNVIELDSITRDIESLYKGMNIFYSGENQASIPADKVGLGNRSWAVFSTIKALNTISHEKAFDLDEALLTIILIEEPEAHIHPQAQRKLLKDILQMQGQLFITTHSNYIFFDIDFDDIIYVQMSNASSVFSRVDFSGLEIKENEIRSIKRNFMKSNADLLYCTCVVLIEGETEEYALPVYFKNYFGKTDYEKGVNFVSVDGSGERYIAYLRILEAFNIPWYIFSDGEEKIVTELNKKLKDLSLPGKEVHDDFDNVFVIPGLKCYEEFLIDQGYSSEIKHIINEIEKTPHQKMEYVDYYISINQGNKRKGGGLRDYTLPNGKEIALIDIMKGEKTKYSESIAEIISMKQIPDLIKNLLASIKGKIGE